MDAAQSFESAWTAYQESARNLYTPPAGAAADRSDPQIYAQHLDQNADELLSRSQQVREVLVSNLQVDDLSRRELASLKLLAAAAYDLSVANDLAEMEESGPITGADRSARGAVLASAELREVLDAPLEGGMAGIRKADRGGVLSDNPAVAREQLKEAIDECLSEIPVSSTAVSQLAVGGLIGVGLAPAQKLATGVVKEVVARIPEGLGLIARRIANLVVEAVRKVLSILGEERQNAITKKVSEWLDSIKEDKDKVAGLLGQLYETERIKAEVLAVVDNSPQDTEAARFNVATRNLQNLLGDYQKANKIVTLALNVFGWGPLRTVVLGMVPWGPLAVYAGYLGVLSYSIFSGGDHVDWYRVESQDWLDRVKGVRTVVREALGTAQ